MILSTLVTSQLHFEMCAGLYGHPVLDQVSTHNRVRTAMDEKHSIDITYCYASLVLKVASKAYG